MMMNTIDLDIAERSVFAGGASFGESGVYEKLEGRARFAIDPEAPAQAGIADLAFAPRDAHGMVRFAADFVILKPLDLPRGHGRLLFEWCNRGNKFALQCFNDAPACNKPAAIADAGNGFLFRRGYTVAWLAWQGDLWPGNRRMLIDLPVAQGRDGPITGQVRREFIVEQPGITTLPLSGVTSGMSYPAYSLDTACAILTRRRYPEDPREFIPSSQWRFAREEQSQALNPKDSETAIIPSPEHIYLGEGFRPGWIYELIYSARDPRILGLGFVAVREFLAFLRHENSATKNPLAGSIEKLYGWGHSQSARAIREFIYRGFNADARGRRIYDGILVHAPGAGRMWLNHRFAHGSSMAGQQYEEHYNVADRFPFSYAATTDHLTGRTDALLTRPATDPLVMHMQMASEYWQRRGSLVHTDTQGNDLEQPPNVRLYHFSSSPHFAPATAASAAYGICQLLSNGMSTTFLVRAILVALDEWASLGKAPPESRIPKRSDGTLVAYEAWRRQFPAIAGIAVPVAPNGLPLLDFGPQEDQGLLTTEPPEIIDGLGYAVLVPAVDSDGNEISGIRAPRLEVPVATYTGWNLRSDGQGKGAMYKFTGGMIPFSATPGERYMTEDPRPSIQERYGDAAAYRQLMAAAARRLYAARLLLEEDLTRLEEPGD
jgi:hypothetical protein